MRDAQLLTCVSTPALAAKPLAVEEMGTGERRTDLGPAKPVDRLPVQVLRCLTLAHQGA